MAEVTKPQSTSYPLDSKPVVVVHHLDDSRSQRILWLLEELEVPYEVKKYKRTAQRLAPKELLDVHSLGKSPVITDGNLTVAESGAIVEYLIKKYGGDKAVVKESGWVDNLYYTHFAEGTLQPLLVRRLIFRLTAQQAPTPLRPAVSTVLTNADETAIGPDLKRIGDLIEVHLAKTTWFAGGDVPTSADYMMAFTLEIFVNRAPEYAGPAIMNYVKMVQDRPAYKRALEKGGEYAYVLK